MPLSTQEAVLFDVFKKSCAERHLLDQPAGISDDDVRDGINDDTALLYGSLSSFFSWGTILQVSMCNVPSTFVLYSNSPQTVLSCPST